MHNSKIDIVDAMRNHYTETFEEFGATSKGVDWGRNEDLILRYDKILEVIKNKNQEITILDVGCGYGGLYERIKEKNINVKYSGIDLCENMIEYAKKIHSDSKFYCEDIMKMNLAEYDYVVCNGILTQKLEISILNMDEYAKKLIKKMFSISREGIAFNIMTNKVNFTVPNLYYKSPVELLSFCLEEVSLKVKIDHSYPLYEYMVYIYK